LLARYTAWLAIAHLLTAAEVTAVAFSLGGHTTGPARTLMSDKNLILAAMLMAVSTVAVVTSGVVILGAHLYPGLPPDSSRMRLSDKVSSASCAGKWRRSPGSGWRSE
jgi:hypothetical protein